MWKWWVYNVAESEGLVWMQAIVSTEYGLVSLGRYVRTVEVAHALHTHARSKILLRRKPRKVMISDASANWIAKRPPRGLAKTIKHVAQILHRTTDTVIGGNDKLGELSTMG